MGLFTDEYKKLLIIQYADKPKAKSHIELLLSKLEEIYNLIKQDDIFDVDLAVGKQLDTLGKIVGISRNIPFLGISLDDEEYRFIIKAKITKNYAKATMIDENKLSIQNTIDFLFKNKAYVVDNKDMTMTIYIDKSFNFDIIQYITKLDLIPRPQGVKNFLVKYIQDYTFGFKDNIYSKSFGDKFNNQDDETYFAEKILY